MLAIAGILAQGICRAEAGTNGPKAACTQVIKRGKAEKWAARSERLAASLRENLKRRKAQARGRGGSGKSNGNAAARHDGPEMPEPDFRRNRSPV
jgi:hypothetical protein